MLALENIGELFLAPPQSPLRGAHLVVEDGRIADFGAGTESRLPPEAPRLDARGGAVTPGLIDSHTHLVFAGTREDEFVRRARGESYLQIAKAGGGIQSTVRAVRRASLDELVALGLPRLRRMLAHGVTTVEIKSGYGLDVENEIKMLEAVRRLRDLQPIELVATYLAAHTVPEEFRDRREAYVDLVTGDALLGRVAAEGLAEFCDVFCEASAFSLAESRRILLAGKKAGLSPKIHADQITQMGASRLAAEVGAVSAEHLEHIDDEGIARLKEAGVLAGLMPGCSFFLGVAPAPARRILDAGIPVTLSTDYNPGSSLVESLPLVMSMACTQMRMTPTEALQAATAHAAASLRRQDRLGRIAAGMQADLLVLDVPSVDQWLYHVGRECVRAVIKNGEVVHQRSEEHV